MNLLDSSVLERQVRYTNMYRQVIPIVLSAKEAPILATNFKSNRIRKTKKRQLKLLNLSNPERKDFYLNYFSTNHQA